MELHYQAGGNPTVKLAISQAANQATLQESKLPLSWAVKGHFSTKPGCQAGTNELVHRAAAELGCQGATELLSLAAKPPRRKEAAEFGHQGATELGCKAAA